jgi:hypothetical protein
MPEAWPSAVPNRLGEGLDASAERNTKGTDVSGIESAEMKREQS